MHNPSVYVGTYAKYNYGSIEGGWISLLQCKNYDDFLHKCYRLHSNEREPELMIQDIDDFPDGLSCGEYLGEQDFNDIIAACKAEAKAQAKVGKDKALLDEYMAEMEKVWGDDKEMMDYNRKKFSSAIRLQNGGLLCFERPKICNRFCFEDEGVGLKNYKFVTSDAERLKKYFLSQNLVGFEREIELLSNPDGTNGTLYIQREHYARQTAPLNLWRWVCWNELDVRDNPWKYPGEYEKMTDADRKAILAGDNHERDKFEKRLQTYLKRYGTSKIRTWTYWANA